MRSPVNHRGADLIIGVALLVGLLSTQGQILPSSPTTEWTPILYGSSLPDPTGDQQTASAEADIIGTLQAPSLYMKYADGGASTNGWLGFRMRLAADDGKIGFKSVAMVGLDADLDGVLDLFLGVNNQGSSASLAIWSRGIGANTSPGTTGITTPAINTYAETSANYAFAPVTLTLDPTAPSLDIDGGGSTDYFLTFVLPFNIVISGLAAQGILGITEDSPLQLLALTASQQNNLNQDINGVNGGIGSTLTWGELGGLSLPYAFNSLEPVPEPNTVAVCLAGILILISRFRLKL